MAEAPSIPPRVDGLLLTRQDVAVRLALSVPTIDRLIGRHELKAVRIGRAIRVRVTDLDRFIERLAAVR